jgi:hypothetical protein
MTAASLRRRQDEMPLQPEAEARQRLRKVCFRVLAAISDQYDPAAGKTPVRYTFSQETPPKNAVDGQSGQAECSKE